MSSALAAAHYSLFATSIGDCGIAWRDNVVVASTLPEKSPAEAASRLQRAADATEQDPPAEIAKTISAIVRLLNGEKIDLSAVECDFSAVNRFESRVYAVTRAIPAGRMKTYGDVAEALGDKQLAQSVGRALGRNPFPIIVPCHRVMGANNKPTGFSAYGGVETKLRMLAIEGAQMGDSPGLFDDL